MKYLIIAISVFFISNAVFSQSGKILYEVHLDIDLKVIDKKHIEFFTQLVDYGNSQQFELLFNNNQSSFKDVEKLSSNPDFDKNMELVARTFINSLSDVYVDFREEKVVLEKPDGTLIENKYDVSSWEITTDSKTIGGYLAYKAIRRDHFIGSKGQPKTLEAIAWFAPSLPYKFGPIDYYGLPGLILELTQNKATFLAAKIELEKNDIKVDFPKGETTTKEQYEKKLMEKMGMK